MAAQIVMDSTGDTRHYFDAEDTKALSKAEARFKMLTAVGFTAAVRDATGKATITRMFDPTAEETLFFHDSLAADDRLHVHSPANFRAAQALAFLGRRYAQPSIHARAARID